ncbi:ATP-binding cassette domain-containing protein [Microbacterium sp. Sa4CUA7]|uniref:ATP-binding cassette domain-containing protein n=1 Tax=Microbacterium pullorum TaxID=2762236 RepID=A0ABR8RZR0_9MICO|nr:ABC transporter ATP-binding protein [Microbacterium pullorum]MBD7956728.1 ATP-binding cassette domain-containing protein [Microbacterium pullorum]
MAADPVDTVPPEPAAGPAPEVVAEADSEPSPAPDTPVDATGQLGIAPESAAEDTAADDTETVTAAEPVVAAEPVIDVEPIEVESLPETEVFADVEAVTAVVSAMDEHPLEDHTTQLPALALRGVTKLFGGTAAVDGIDLTVPAGSFYGLVGPNGAGKTTTLSMIAGLLRPDRGSIRINGVDAASDPAGAKRLMGVLPDRLRTFDRLTGRQLLHYYGLLRGLPAGVADSRAADLARAFDLTDALSRPVSDYSGGMTKKIMLAGALIHSPRVLVLDEPFEAVDPVSSAVILDILGAYVSHGGTVILSSHGMDLVERVCSRVAVIVAGQVLAEGTVDDVRGELTLEQRFVELAGGLSDVEGLEWLHTFSG